MAQRKATINRSTKETTISVTVNIDGTGNTSIKTAFAFALGFHAAINGVAANGIPERPTALVSPIKTFLLVLSFSCISL